MNRVRGALTLLSLIALTGCDNPFDPTAKIRLLRFFANAGVFETITQSTALSQIASPPLIETDFANYSTVAAQITSYSVVYRQLTAQPAPVSLPPGSPIPALGGAAGRRFNGFIIHIDALSDNRNANGYNTFTMFGPQIITAELLNYIGGGFPGIGGTSTIGGGIDCELIFYGEDHNGHDIKVSGVLHIEID